MRRLHAWVGAGVALTLAACTGDAGSTSRTTDDPTSPSRSSAVAAELAGRLDPFFDKSYGNAIDDVRALLVVVDGHRVYERYNDSAPETTHPTASVTKSVMSILIGIALDEGHLGGVDQTLADLLPDYTAVMASGVPEVTLQQVLTMTSGLAEGELVVSASGDPVADALSSGLATSPGRRFAYSSPGSHLLSAILTEATGVSTLDFAREHLFDPLGISTAPAAEPLAYLDDLPAYRAAGFAWPVDPQGRHLGSEGLKLRTTDMARIGQLMLQEGVWEGKQIVSAAWVGESTRRHVDAVGSRVTDAYAYQWWLTSGGHDGYAAVGHGAQLIEVVPELDLVVAVSTFIPDGTPRLDEAGLLSMLRELIEPIVTP